MLLNTASELKTKPLESETKNNMEMTFSPDDKFMEAEELQRIMARGEELMKEYNLDSDHKDKNYHKNKKLDGGRPKCNVPK